MNFKGFNCDIVADRYTDTGNHAWRLIDSDDGSPVATATVNSDFVLPDHLVGIKDYSENAGMVEFLSEEGFIEEEPVTLLPVGHTEISVHKIKRNPGE